MNKHTLIIALATILSLFLSVTVNAKTDSIQSMGFFSSPKGFGLTYSYVPRKFSAAEKEDVKKQNTDWANVTVWGDIYGLISGKTTKPGIKANYSRLYSFASVHSNKSAGIIRFYAGPGISGGWVMDNGYGNSTNAPVHGAALALSGSIGVRYNFNDITCIDISLTGETGLHLTGFDSSETFRTRFYRNGIFQAWYPQLKIEHIFQSKSPGSRRTKINSSNSSVSKRRTHIVYGLEWGLSPTVYEIHKYIYIDEDIGCLMPKDERAGFTFNNNAFIMANIGCAFGLHSDLRLEGGYMGAYKKINMIPLALRYTFLIRNQLESDGRSGFFRLGCGLGLPLDNKLGSNGNHPEGFLKYWLYTGGGWRFPISSIFTMEIGGSLKIIYDRPDLKNSDTGKYVSRKNIRRNDAWYISPCLSLAINF